MRRRAGTAAPIGHRRAVRPLIVGLAVTAAIVLVAVLGLMLGDFTLTPGEVFAALTGHGSRAADLVVVDWRLPRVLLAALTGCAFGISGAIFQSISRNALGSPDIIGFTSGAASGALVQILVVGASGAAVSGGAIAGGFVTAAIVYGLSFKGGVQGYRLVLVGIGVSAVLMSLNSYLILRAQVDQAQGAAIWITGTLNGRGWPEDIAVGICLALLMPMALKLNPSLALMEMGDDTAKALGVSVERDRMLLMVVGVGLTAVATAAVGPIAFVALASPHLARMLCRSHRPGPVTAGLMGALLMMVADFAAQRLFAPTQLPTGVLTSAIGGAYLAWLLTRQWRAGRG
nr:iron chelate uptake ABC transporter family permease subunit [Spelaeicoccus albus]